MEIERINDDTVKFYISYMDIEERGFDREEIWYSRERSEELFWEMMDEIHQEEEFTIEGPLWIQVQALEKGLEILVTRAQFSKDGQKVDFLCLMINLNIFKWMIKLNPSLINTSKVMMSIAALCLKMESLSSSRNLMILRMSLHLVIEVV